MHLRAESLALLFSLTVDTFERLARSDPDFPPKRVWHARLSTWDSDAVRAYFERRDSIVTLSEIRRRCGLSENKLNEYRRNPSFPAFQSFGGRRGYAWDDVRIFLAGPSLVERKPKKSD